MFRFTIRDVLWLMVAVSMAGAWWADRTAIKLAYLDCDNRLHPPMTGRQSRAIIQNALHGPSGRKLL